METGLEWPPAFAVELSLFRRTNPFGVLTRQRQERFRRKRRAQSDNAERRPFRDRDGYFAFGRFRYFSYSALCLLSVDVSCPLINR